MLPPPVARWAVAAAFLGLLLAHPFSALRAEEPSPWSDEIRIQALFTEACEAAEKACGARFETRPELRISTSEEVERVLADELAALATDEAASGALRQVLSVLATSLLAKTEPAQNRVHVLPANADRLAQLLERPALAGEDVLRVVLAHEAVHALDFQRFGHLDEIRTGENSSAEARQAVGAVLEGHAQLVSQQIAASWDLSSAWEAYTETITMSRPGAEGAEALLGRIFAAEMEFAYHQGLSFLRAVHEARGREGVEAVLRSPPTRTRVIERPVLWLDPDSASKEPDLDVLLAPTGSTLEEHLGSVGGQRLLEAQVRAQLSVLPAAELEAAMNLYVDGQVAASANTETGETAIFALLRLRDAAAATAWVAVERRVARLKDEQFKTGPIRITEARYADIAYEGASSAFEMQKTIRLPGQEQHALTRVFAFGRHVIEVSGIDVSAPLMRELDAALDGLVERLLAQEAPVEETAVPAAGR